jgi:hypothetical protein
MQTYKLHQEMVGVSRFADGHMQIVTLPVGAVLEVATLTLQSGLVDAKWEGEAVSVFVQDLKEHGTLIKTVGA